MSPISIFFLSVLSLDTLIFLYLIPKIHKSGNQHYLFSSVHRFTSWFYASFFFATHIHIINSGIGTEIVFIISYLYILNYNFDINSFIKNDPSSEMKEEEKKSLDEDSRAIVELIEKTTKLRAALPFLSRLNQKISLYTSSLVFSFSVLTDFVFRRKDNLRAMEEMHSALQVGKILATATFLENFKAYSPRVLANAAFAIMVVTSENAWFINVRFSLYFMEIKHKLIEYFSYFIIS